MIKKQSVVALVLLLLIPVVCATGGLLFSLINPELAAGHPNYGRNFHFLTLLKLMCIWASAAIACVLWVLVFLVVIRSRKRSYLWLFLAALGPFGLPILIMLHDRSTTERDRYAQFVGKMNWLVRAAYEVVVFMSIWALAYQAMVLKRILMVRYEAATTGVSTAQIIDIQNASSGMWAFSEGLEVVFLVVLLYLLWPVFFCLAGNVAEAMASPRSR
jgi:hypothetical protein